MPDWPLPVIKALPVSPHIADTDEGASGLMRMMFNINELTTDEAICAWTGDTDVFPLNSTKFTPSNGVVLNMFNRLVYSDCPVQQLLDTNCRTFG